MVQLLNFKRNVNAMNDGNPGRDHVLQTVGLGKGFNPLTWFASGEQGAWYDPSDLTTLFQDSAGTIPVTAVEQPVGLMKDKSGRNNHASQATSGNRPILSARVNLLLATDALSTQSVTTAAASYTLAFTGAGTVTLSGTATGVLSAGSNTFTATAGTLTLTVSGSVTLADLRPTNAGARLPAYQRVNTSTDYDTAGFPLYLACNGTSSAMSTSSINFTATAKMTVMTGVRKLVDQNNSVPMELSTVANSSNPGSFTILAPLGISANYTAACIGNAAGASTTTSALNYLAPISNVLTVLEDISATSPNEIILKVNGAFTGTQSLDCGTGNFGNYPLYLFARAGTSLLFNGQFYGGIIRGAQSDAASISQNEQFMAQKTGISF